jgi:hypothetical protein
MSYEVFAIERCGLSYVEPHYSGPNDGK